MADWTQLPRDALETISKRLTSSVDYIRFRSICTSWRSAAPKKNQLPWLMLPGESNTYSFYSLTDGQSHTFRAPDEATGMECFGTSHGWLIMASVEARTALLWNPMIAGAIILLPLLDWAWRTPTAGIGQKDGTGKMEDISGYTIRRAILSSNPTSTGTDTVVMAIFYPLIRSAGTPKLVLCKLSDKMWTVVKEGQYLTDVWCHGMRCYVPDGDSSIIMCDVGPPVTSTVMYSLQTLCSTKHGPGYLVSCGGKLLLVMRYHSGYVSEETGYRKDLEFAVFEVDLSSHFLRFRKVESLGSRMLLLGLNQSMSLSASDFPGCRGNRVYFSDFLPVRSDADVYGLRDFGIFNLEDRSVELLPADVPINRKPSAWFTPSLC